MKALAWKLLVINFVLCFVLPASDFGAEVCRRVSRDTRDSSSFWIIKDAGYFKQEGLDSDRFISPPHRLWRKRCWPGRSRSPPLTAKPW